MFKDIRRVTHRMRTEAEVSEDDKFCPRCRQVKDRSEFQKNAARVDGKQPYCRECQNDATADSRHLATYLRQWQKANKE